MKVFLPTLISVLTLSATASWAAMPAGMDMGTIRASAIVADQDSQPGTGVTVDGGSASTVSRSTFSGRLDWTPSLVLMDKLWLKVDLGVSMLKSSADSTFAMTDYEALLAFALTPTWLLEGGGGAQTWFSNGGTHAVTTGNLAYLLPKESLFSEIFVGYSHFFLPGAGTHEGHLGVAVNSDRF